MLLAFAFVFHFRLISRSYICICHFVLVLGERDAYTGIGLSLQIQLPNLRLYRPSFPSSKGCYFGCDGVIVVVVDVMIIVCFVVFNIV